MERTVFFQGMKSGQQYSVLEEEEMFVDIFSLITNIEDYDVELIGNIHQEAE
jgi:hypothetical protein